MKQFRPGGLMPLICFNARPGSPNPTFQYQERDQEEWFRDRMNKQQSHTASSFVARPSRSESNSMRVQSNGNQNAQKRYAQYLELARYHASIGDRVGAENYSQHAEHYFRTMARGAN
jgi:hypothetical protein